jgi:hypothetical protein
LASLETVWDLNSPSARLSAESLLLYNIGGAMRLHP